MSNASEERFNTYKRRLPHWRQGGSVYFVTYGVLNKLSLEEVGVAAEQVLSGHREFYWLYGGVVMLDHVHLLLQPLGEYTLSRILKGLKGTTAGAINLLRNNRGTVFQDESYDRIVRNDAEFDEKLAYMFNNPLKEGLCSDPWEYPGWIAP